VLCKENCFEQKLFGKAIGRIRLVVATQAVAAMVLVTAGPSAAAEFSLLDGEVTGKLSMTLGYGLSVRTEDPITPELFVHPSSKADTTWNNSGDVVSNVGKVLAEVGLDYKNYGLVSNISYIYDTEIMAGGTGRAGTIADTGLGNEWSDGAEETSGSSLELLDAYVYGTFEPMGMPLEVRLGKQVINWGEGLYFMDGISTQVPFYIGKLVLPGSELKEAFIGVGAAYAQIAPTDSLSLGAYYQYEWQEHEFPGVGTFYGDDLFGPGGVEEWQNGFLFPLDDTTSVFVPGLKGSSSDASSDGQWGASGRYILGDWELGLYYSRYHHFFPQVKFETNQNTVLTDAAGNPIMDLPLDGFVAREVFPEDQDMFGTSFSTSLGMWSVNGEIAYRPDNVLTDNYTELFGVANGVSGEEHDTINASIHGIGLYGRGPLGIDSNVYMIQIGWDHINGDTSRLLANSYINRGELQFADKDAFGLAAEWGATWQNVLQGLDITTALFVQYDFNGNSHYTGNFAEDRLLTSFGVTFNYGTGWEANLNYARADFADSVYEKQDTVNFSVNYKF
jgi:hypothetical protein